MSRKVFFLKSLEWVPTFNNVHIFDSKQIRGLKKGAQLEKNPNNSINFPHSKLKCIKRSSAPKLSKFIFEKSSHKKILREEVKFKPPMYAKDVLAASTYILLSLACIN